MTASAPELIRLVDEFDAALRDGRPEDVFGTASPQVEYRHLARLCHPDHHDGAPEAYDAFLLLSELWQLASQLIGLGRYGQRVVFVRTKTRRYAFLGKTGRDDVADHFAARWGVDGGGYARVARKPHDNDLILTEAGALKRITTAVDYPEFFPDLVETVAVRQSGGVIRQANIFRREPSWYSLQHVLDRYPRGVDPRDMAWIWRRLLTVLGAAHRAGAIHGAVTPANVSIEPRLHGLILENWSYSVPKGGTIPAIERAYRDLYAPEVVAKEPAGRGSDIYLGARSMVALVGDAEMPTRLRAFFRACALDRARRPRDAWALLSDFDELLVRTYGPNRFRPFPEMTRNQPEGGTAR